MVGGQLHFGMLGPLEVSDGGRPLDLGRTKQRAVLAALLVHANRVVSLDRFADVLWPAGGPARTAGNLSVYIANLRRLLEPGRAARAPSERILTRAPGYLLRVGPGEYDVADFEALATSGNRHLAEGRPRAARRDLGEALALWRGPAMDEFDFAEREADRLERLRVGATEDRVEADLALGAHTAVVDELEALVQEYGLRERLVGQLMLALYRSGRQSEALRAYTATRQHLARQLGLEPGPELQRMEAAILAHSPDLDWRPPPAEGPVPPQVHPDAPPAVTPGDPFVGRTAELAAMQRALGAGAPGGIVLVSGEPGIGKTRLVREALGPAVAGGCVVAWGQCEEGDGAPPFWPWLQVIRALLEHPDTEEVRAALGPHGPELAQLVPEVRAVTGELPAPGPLDPAGARYRFFDAVGGFLGRLSHRQPLAVVLDDLHWADPPSLQLAVHLARRAPAPAVLVATYRDVDPAPTGRLTEALADLARLPGRLVVPLEGLTQHEVGEFIAHEAGEEAPAGVVHAVWARAAGNPFFVGELTRLLVADKSLTVEGAASAGVPWAVRQVVGRRLERLPSGTRQLLTVAAVAGTEFDLRVVAAAGGVDLDQALDLVDLAVAAGVVTEQPVAACFRFSHALVQETLYSDATRLRRARLHALVADALELVQGEQAPATEIARHLYEAVTVTGPSRAVAAALRASTSAQAALAPEVAEDHLRRALALVATMAPGRDRDHHELEVQHQLASLLTLVKGVAVPETAAAWTRATELCREVGDRRSLLPSLWGQLSFAWASSDMTSARALGAHLLRLGLGSDEPAVAAVAHLGMGSVAMCSGELERALRHLGAGKALADGVPDHQLADVTHADLRVQVDSWLAMARHIEGAHEEGRLLVEEAVARAGALGQPFTVAISLAFAVFSRVLSDDVAGARRLAAELLAQSGTHQLADFAFHARVAQVWAAARGDAPAAELVAMLEALPPAATASIRPWRPFWLALLAAVWQQLDRVEEAGRCVEEGLAEVEVIGSSFCLPELLRLRGELLATAAPERRAEALADLDEAVREARAQGAAVYLERALGSAARVAGAPADA